jgi:phenylpropionate dioxygenase-like ring-hydroxylating dioxygenase large terminal subunit
MEWLPIAEDARVGTRPTAVVAAGVPLVVLRPAAEAAPVVFADRCPHRLVPLSAATFEDGRLRCAYHGWEFDSAGACVDLPSQDSKAPPRADLPAGPRIKVEDGTVFVHTADLQTIAGDPDDLLTNDDPALRGAWHPLTSRSCMPAPSVRRRRRSFPGTR